MTRRPDPGLRYLMPAIAGYEPGTAGTWYHDVTGMAATYLTRREAVAGAPAAPSEQP
jgi:hypothetical protein